MENEYLKIICEQLQSINKTIEKELVRQRSWRLLKFALYLLAFAIIYLLIDTRLS